MSTTTLTLAAFLAARLDEDEAAALAVRARHPWHSEQRDSTLVIDTEADDSMGWEFGGGSGVWVCDDPYDDCDLYRSAAFAEADHIARHDPARVLAEVSAKRAVLACRAQLDAGARTLALSNPDEANAVRMSRFGLDVAIKCLAAVYSDHPDYDEAWRP